MNKKKKKKEEKRRKMKFEFKKILKKIKIIEKRLKKLCKSSQNDTSGEKGKDNKYYKKIILIVLLGMFLMASGIANKETFEELLTILRTFGVC
ncbi:MAG: hypothetical protein J1E39_02140 [Eubacterium sp.]|nr:hypothetical protein [Eubacterium sp.]